MKYLSFDIEATGLDEDCLIIEYAMVPFDSETRKISHEHSYHSYIKCPSFKELKPKLNSWVVEHNQQLIEKAHTDGIPISQFKEQMISYLKSSVIKEYFSNERIVLFGKSMNSIDLPFLKRDLGWDFMNKYFHHRVLDLSCLAIGLIDMNLLEKGMDSGEKMMKAFGMGEVEHTALADAVNTAKMYFEILSRVEKQTN